MADLKISQLSSLTKSTVATNDTLPIVDTSAGATKQISYQELLQPQDDQFAIVDNSDTTKKVAFQVSGVTTGTTRTLTVPDSNTTIVGTDTTQTLTNKTLTAPQINMGSDATGDIYYRASGGSFSRLAIGSSDQILAVQSGIPAWIANPTASDASYTVKGIVKFDTDAATSGVTVTSGVAALNTGTTANKIVKLDSSAKLPAVDGSQLTNLSITSNNGTTTRDLSLTSTQTIAHGLGRTPKSVRITAQYNNSYLTMWKSLGFSNGSTNSCLYEMTTTSGATFSSFTQGTSSHVINMGGNTNFATATATFDATNITLTWTKTGTPTGTANIVWETQ